MIYTKCMRWSYRCRWNSQWFAIERCFPLESNCQQDNRSSAFIGFTQDNICRIQEVLKKPPLAVVLENNTRWNSFRDTLKRLIELKEVLTLAMSDDFEDFNWKDIENVCKLLQPLKEATMALQEKSADAKLAVRVIKHFYDMVKDRMRNLNQTPQGISADHAYIAPKKVCRFTEFVEQSMSDDFDIFSYMQNFKPTSCDPECIFSLCRLTKNYLQNKLTPANHSRNVSFNKNKHLFAPNSGS